MVSSADRNDHELLEVDRVVGMGAAIDDVHHRNRQDMGVRTADIAVQRQTGGLGGSLGDGERHAEDGVGAEARLVRRTIELDHQVVDLDLVFGIMTADRIIDLAIDRFDGLFNALAEITRRRHAVRRLHAHRSRRPRDRSAAHAAIFEIDVDLYGRVATAVEDLAADDVGDGGHVRSL